MKTINISKEKTINVLDNPIETFKIGNLTLTIEQEIKTKEYYICYLGWVIQKSTDKILIENLKDYFIEIAKKQFGKIEDIENKIINLYNIKTK